MRLMSSPHGTCTLEVPLVVEEGIEFSLHSRMTFWIIAEIERPDD